jgi:hypothetical protein
MLLVVWHLIVGYTPYTYDCVAASSLPTVDLFSLYTPRNPCQLLCASVLCRVCMYTFTLGSRS